MSQPFLMGYAFGAGNAVVSTPYWHAAELLTADQITILEDPKNQWRENHGAEANDPSAN